MIAEYPPGRTGTALRFTQRLLDAGVTPSTGSVRDSLDNTLTENLLSTIKVTRVLARHHIRHARRGRGRSDPLHRDMSPTEGAKLLLVTCPEGPGGPASA